MDILKKAAEILVLSGYAECHVKAPKSLRQQNPEWHDNYDATHLLKLNDNTTNFPYYVDPFSDTLEGRRQACAAIEHIRLKHNDVWLISKVVNSPFSGTWWEHALARLEYCLSELSK